MHEEHVDGIAEVGARPHPGSAGRHLSLARGDARKKGGVVGQLEYLPAGVLRIAFDLLDAAQIDSFVRRAGDRVDVIDCAELAFRPMKIGFVAKQRAKRVRLDAGVRSVPADLIRPKQLTTVPNR